MSKKNKSIILLPLVGLFGLAIGVIATNIITTMNNQKQQQDFSLLAKRTQVDNPNDPKVNFTDLRNELESYVSELETDQEINSASVYFEYLPTGVSINVNENNEAVAASLMKVPFVMTLYKAAQEGKIDLDKTVKLKKEWLNSEYGTLYQKGEGYEITIREAAKLALKDSDNTALLLVSAQLEETVDTQEVFNFLDMEYEINSDERVLIGPRSYSSVMKCLYLACYNSKQDAQEMLSYLTESSFDNRLTNLLPDDIKVAHKIGTYFTEFQSDCGIIYVPERNYILCVMIDGDDPLASRTISVISNKVYSYITNN